MSVKKGIWWLAPVVAFSSYVAAADVLDEPKMSVLEMIRIDAELGLLNEQKRLSEVLAAGKPAPAAETVAVETALPSNAPPVAEGLSASEPAALPAVQLISIFGTPGRLFVDVQVSEGRVRFAQGSESPLGMPDAFPYRLASIRPPCAVFKVAGAPNTKVCLTESH